MAINRWLGVAQSRVAKQALQPKNITPGSVWTLRVGSQSFSYEYPASIEVGTLSDNDRAQTVCDGLVAAFSGGAGLGGGSTLVVGSVESELYNGRWSVVVTGPSNGAPLDVQLTGEDPASARISVVQLQAGRAAQNEIQRIKFPATPTGGTWFVRYRNQITSSLAHNITAANLQTALRALSSIGASNVNVSGSAADGYVVEFVGSLAGTNADLLVAFSNDFTGVASFRLDKTVSGGIGRQQFTLPAISRDVNQTYRFEYEGEQSHLFTGATTVAALIAALESIATIGVGNVNVEQLADQSYTITLIGVFVGRAGGTLSLANVSTSENAVPLASSVPTFTATTTVVVVTFLNMPASGTFTLNYGANTTAGIAFSGSTPIGTVASALTAASITEWVATAAVGGQNQAYQLTLTAVSTGTPRDIGVILPNVSGLIGCNAIDVRTTQLSQTARNEVQQIGIATDPVGGTFTLTFGANTTAGLAFNASAATIQTALQGLASIGAGNATVSGPVGGPFIVEFRSSLGSAAQSLISGNGASLTMPNVASASALVLLIPTGPNWYTNASNWSLGTVPDSSDVATWDAGSVPCLYGLTNVPAVAGIDVFRTYTGSIGLPERKPDGSPETLQQYLSLSDGGGTIPIRIGIGDEGAGPSIVRINTQAQDASVSLLYSSQAGGDQLYTVGLAGDMSTLHAADCSLQIATASGLTATVGSLRVSPQNRADDGAVVEVGEGATVASVELVAGTLRMGSIPGSLTVHSGLPSIRGTSGALNSLVLRNARLRYLAGGSIGKFGPVTALALNSDDEARITSAAHGLVSGDRIYLRGVVGVVGLPDGYYTILRVDANTFDLVGTAPAIPFGATSPTAVADYYQASTAQWGLADSVRLGDGGILDMSELSLTRTIVAPVLLQAVDAEVIDTLNTVSGLRIKSDPGLFEGSLGNRALIKRE
jgi:trimeric autotransporter adhesin